jgi:hypothetical protein
MFVDGAVVGAASLHDITSPTTSTTTGITGAITPGFGLRYRSPIGPIRVDLGINPKLKEELNVITEDETGQLVQVTCSGASASTCPNSRRAFNPAGAAGGSFLARIVNRLTLHLSIGEAY